MFDDHVEHIHIYFPLICLIYMWTKKDLKKSLSNVIIYKLKNHGKLNNGLNYITPLGAKIDFVTT
jgi:hypothetical protein